MTTTSLVVSYPLGCFCYSLSPLGTYPHSQLKSALEHCSRDSGVTFRLAQQFCEPRLQFYFLGKQLRMERGALSLSFLAPTSFLCHIISCNILPAALCFVLSAGTHCCENVHSVTPAFIHRDPSICHAPRTVPLQRFSPNRQLECMSVFIKNLSP